MNQWGEMYRNTIAGTVSKAAFGNKPSWMLSETYSAIIQRMGLPVQGASFQHYDGLLLIRMVSLKGNRCDSNSARSE